MKYSSEIIFILSTLALIILTLNNSEGVDLLDTIIQNNLTKG